MECLEIDWKNIDDTFVADAFYESIQAPTWVDFNAPEQPVDDHHWFCGRVGCPHEKDATCDELAALQNSGIDLKETSKSTELHAPIAVAAMVAPLVEKAVSAATGKRARLVVSASLSSLSELKSARLNAKGKFSPLNKMHPITEGKVQGDTKPSSVKNQTTSENDNPNQVSKVPSLPAVFKVSNKGQEGAVKKLKRSEMRAPAPSLTNKVPTMPKPDIDAKAARETTVGRSLIGNICSKDLGSNVSDCCTKIKRLAIGEEMRSSRSLANIPQHTLPTKKVLIARRPEERPLVPKQPRYFTATGSKCKSPSLVRVNSSDCTLATSLEEAACAEFGAVDQAGNLSVPHQSQPQLMSEEGKQFTEQQGEVVDEKPSSNEITTARKEEGNHENSEASPNQDNVPERSQEEDSEKGLLPKDADVQTEAEQVVQETLGDLLRDLQLVPDAVDPCSSQEDTTLPEKFVHSYLHDRDKLQEESQDLPSGISADKPAISTTQKVTKNGENGAGDSHEKTKVRSKQAMNEGKKRKSTDMTFKVNCSSKEHGKKASKAGHASCCTRGNATTAAFCPGQHKKLRTNNLQQLKPPKPKIEERSALKELELNKKEICPSKKEGIQIATEVQFEEQEDLKRLREQMGHRALKMPFFGRPFQPQRSSKKLTVPKEPNFHSLRSRKTCTKHHSDLTMSPSLRP